ncbi:MAG: response regulator [Gemmatimonadales bacterium]|nr:MAG: response regulator [Gemmatimonadales bacterium]
MILLVEDDDEARMALRRALEWHGHEVLPTRTATEAERVFEERGASIQLLVADVVLPDRSGVDLAGRLAQRRAGLRVLFLSGYDRRELSLDAEGIGPSAFVEKPVTIRRLGDEVRRLLDTPAVTPPRAEGGGSHPNPEAQPYPARKETGWP